MTRINVVPIDELTDNYALAEFYELPRVFVLARKHFDAGRTPAELDIPSTYRMGEGHIKFFYNKMMYLATRHYQLGIALLKRGLEPVQDPATIGCKLPPLVQKEWWLNFAPNMQDIQVNRNRLEFRRRYDGGSYHK